MRIRHAQQPDVAAVAELHGLCFPRQHDSLSFVRCLYSAYPLYRIFVADDGKQTLYAFAIWTEKSGFRKNAILELSLLGVHPELRGQGVGGALVTQSFDLTVTAVLDRGDKVGGVFVTTSAENHAQQLYRRTLGVEKVATIPGLYGADRNEVILHRSFF